MRILLLGGTGMVGQGVLRACLADPQVSYVVAPVRETLGVQSPKLQEVWRGDFFDWVDAGELLSKVDACFFCLGISSLGKSEAEYRRVTYDLTLSLAQALVQASPQAVLTYVTGVGTRATSRQMWARVKAETENELLGMPFRGVYCFRPGYIQPMGGVRSKIRWFNPLYRVLGPLYQLARRMNPGLATSTDAVGRAMLQVAAKGWPAHVLGNADINAAGAAWEQTGMR